MSRGQFRAAARWRLLAAAAILAGTLAGLTAAQNAAPRVDHAQNRGPLATPDAPSAEPEKPLNGSGGHIDGYLAGGRWREGSKLVDVVGRFSVSGDRVAFFVADGKLRFPCLENLNCERVARIIAESPESLEWAVQGTITEFRSENYLLLTQAVIRSRAGRGGRIPPDRLLPPSAAGQAW